MAGAKFTVEFDSRQVLATLEQLLQATGDLRPVFQDIGEYLDLAHRERWDKEVSPDGTPWEPLSDATLRRRALKGVSRGKGQKRKSLTTRKGNTKIGAIRALANAGILVESGGLRETLRYYATDSGLEFGSDRPYGATHQFGRSEAGIPARPWLGVSRSDETEILDILQTHLKNTS